MYVLRCICSPKPSIGLSHFLILVVSFVVSTKAVLKSRFFFVTLCLPCALFSTMITATMCPAVLEVCSVISSVTLLHVVVVVVNGVGWKVSITVVLLVAHVPL